MARMRSRRSKTDSCAVSPSALTSRSVKPPAASSDMSTALGLPMVAMSASGSMPTARAWLRHRERRSGAVPMPSLSGLGARVARAASSPVRLELSPRAERYSSISARRLEKRRRRVGSEPDELGRTAGDGAEADAEGLDQIGPQRRLVDEAGRAGVEVEEPGVGGGPPAVRAEHHIGRQHVGMQLGIARSRSPVDEGGRHQSRRLDPTLAVVSAAGQRGMALEVGQPFGDRPVMSGPDGGRGLRVAESPQHRDRLGGREGEVEPRHPRRAPSPGGEWRAVLG